MQEPEANPTRDARGEGTCISSLRAARDYPSSPHTRCDIEFPGSDKSQFTRPKKQSDNLVYSQLQASAKLAYRG